MSAELMKSKFVRQLPSVRPSASQLSVNLMHRFLSNFGLVLSPGPYDQKKLLTWDPMGTKISKGYYFYKSQAKVLKPLLKFLLNGPHKKIRLWIFFFLNFKFTFFSRFSSLSLTCVSMGAKSLKSYSSLKSL